MYFLMHLMLFAGTTLLFMLIYAISSIYLYDNEKKSKYTNKHTQVDYIYILLQKKRTLQLIRSLWDLLLPVLSENYLIVLTRLPHVFGQNRLKLSLSLSLSIRFLRNVSDLVFLEIFYKNALFKGWATIDETAGKHYRTLAPSFTSENEFRKFLTEKNQ
ncbi:hypothetical protein ACJX0J_029349, partial [Zea mays]